MGRKRTTQKSLRRGLIEEIYNSAPMPQPAQPDYTPSFNSGMSRDEIANIYNSYTPETQEIPTLKPNTTPTTPSISDELERMKKAKADTTTPRTEGEQKAIDTYYDSLVKASGQTPTTSAPKTDYKAEIDRMNAIKADTSTPRTEGENRAIETYLNGLVDAQRYLDSHKPKTNTKKIGTVRVNADGTKTYTKTMSTEEKKNYEDEIRKQAMIERGKEIGKLSLDAAKAGKIKSGRALSANEQRDVERAIEAVNKGQAKAVGKWAKENAYDRGRALSPNEQRDLERAQKAIEKAKEKEQKVYTQTMEMADTYANNAPENSLAVKTISKNETPQPTPTAQNLVGAYADTLVQNGKEQEAVNLVNDLNKTLQTQYENQLNKSNIDDSKWLVKKDELDAQLQNPEFASDMDKLRRLNFDNANQDATVSQEYADTFGAKNITGGFTKDQYLKILEDKYGYNKKELNDIADTLQYYEREKERETYSRDLQMFGALNPKLGTLASYAGTAGNAIEGLWNAGLATISGDPRTQSHLFDTTKNELRHGAEYNYKTDFGKGAYQAIAGLGDLAVGAAYGNAPLVLAGNTAGEATTGAIERGADVNRAGLTGVGAGVADYFFNKVGLDKAKSLAMDKLTAEGAKQFIQQNLIAGGTEAAENVLQDLTETVIDYIINDKQSEIKTIYALKKAQGMTDDEALASTTWDYLKQLGVSAGTGFLMGSGMQAGTTAINNIIPTLTGTPKGEIDTETLSRVNSDIQDAVAQRQAFEEMNRLNGGQQRVNVGDIVNSDARIPELSEPENPFAGQRLTEVNPDDVIYHSGVLSRLNKADSAGKMEGSRDTGYFGTGHYFVDQAHKNQIGKGTGYGDKPYSSVDISQYGNLFKADTDAKADKLHDFSQRMMRYINKHNDKYYTDSEGINADSLKEYMDDMYSQYRDLFGNNALDRNAFEARLNDFRNNYRYDFYDRGDSAFTTFMKEHGYNGVDTRGTRSADVERGVVIYDLDENSVLQSNVTDEATKAGLMNTRVRNGNPVFDANEDARIQKEIDTFNRNEAVRQEYRRIYDDTKLRNAEDEVDRIEKRLDSLENDTRSYYYSLLNDENYLNREARQRVRDFEELGLDTDIESEKQVLLDSAKEGLSEVDEQIKSLNADLERAKANLEAEEKLSDEAYQKAQKTVEGNSNEPLETNNIDSDDTNYSKVYTNTLAKNKIINMANQTSRINAQYNVHHMDDVLNEARNRYLKNADRWEQEFAEGSTEIRSDADVATAMFLLEDKRARIEALQKNGGDKNEIAKLVTERDILARRLRAAGTEKGQAIKAFDYFNGTADGAIINAQRMYDAQAKRWEKKNPNVAKKLEKVADSLGQTQKKQKMSSQLSQALANLGNDSLKAEGKKKKPKTREQIRSEVEATLMNEFSSVEDIFTTEDIDFITDMIESKIPVWQITDELQHRLEHGIWYDIQNDPEKLKKPKNSKLIGALNEITEMPESESDKVKPDFDMVRETVLNTLESEFGSIEGIFDDADIDYIANLINTGATTNELAAMLKTKMSTGMWDIPQETRDKVNDIFARAQQFNENSKERVELETQAFWELANCTKQKASLGEKFEAWRYLAMLGNPKTHIRNIIGNTLFSKVTGVANGLAALMEQRYDAKHFKKTGEHIQRTKAILTKADSYLVKASKEDAYKNAYRALTGDKWHDSRGVQDAIKKQRDIFDSDAVNKANRFNNNALSGEDTFAMINKYKTSLAGYLKANGLDTSIFEDEVRYRKILKDLRGRRPSNAEKAEIDRLSGRIALLQQARDYAVKQAEYSAFHEDNIVADTLSEFSRKLNTSESPFARVLGKMVEGVLPFKKTPANILRSGFEFSPLNIIQDAVRAVKLKHGTGTAAELFESMGKTLTGDMLTIMGAWLFSKGMLNIEDDDTKWQGDLEGRQNYSLVIPIGKDKYTFTVDSLAPSFMPIFLGAQAKKMWDSDIKNPPEEFWGYLSQALESGSQLISPIAETSMLSGVNDTLEALSTNGGLDALATLGLSTITGYASQGIPTLLGQAARTVDPVRRSTYTESNDPLGRTLEKKWQKIENKIPFLSMLNQPYIDAHGDMQYNFTDGKGIIPALGNALYQTASPFYIRKYEPSSGDIVTDRIYDETKDKGVFATNTPSKKIGDKRLTAEQRTEFDTIMGRTNEAIRTALGQNEDFNKMTPEMQKDIFKSLNSFSDAVAESYLNPDKESSNQLFKAYNSAPKYDERGFEAPGVQIQAVVDDIIASNNPYGLDKKTYNEMKDSGEDLTKYEGYAEARAEVGLDDSKGLREAWLDGGLDGVKEFAEYKNALSETGLSDSDANKQAFSSNGIEGLQQVVDNIQKAIDLGFVNKDGTANVSKYDNVLEVMGDDAGVEKYKTISDDIDKKGYSTQADYVPYVLGMPLTTVEKGKILYLEGKPTANSSAEKAYNEYGYAGLAEFRQLQYLNKDYPSKNHPNGDGKIDTYDRIQQLYEWGYNDKSDEFKFYINSGLSYSK